ncbi:carboxylesterase family protein [Polymorphospora sp. NPDC050346]|uniref:carboxylesterase/lipase family protein n=1 Tax=Polymorphospora sp. NPDC050346 TaxID=3155780 RepID=UPI0033DBCCBE
MTDVMASPRAGRVRGVRRDGIASFRGIPYAAAPAGPLRFRPPVPVPAWGGVRDAGSFGVAPPQLPPGPGAPSAWRPADGLDCLSLNVWTPDPGAGGLPVMVWLYGGAFKHGSAGRPDFDATVLASAGVVVVTLNYRIGFEGFGHIPGVPDNRGLRDQIAALEWVRDNVTAFGGDPANVTLFGQSAGAASTALLMTAPAARGLFRRAIAQSIPDACLSPAEARRATAVLAGAAGVAATWEDLAGLSPEEILRHQDAPLPEPATGGSAFTPVVDGDLVGGPPWRRLRDGAGRDIDLICGFTHDEARLYTSAVPAAAIDLPAAAAALRLPERAVADYRTAYPDRTDPELLTVMMSDALFRMPTTRVAEAHTAAGGRTWLYDLTWQSPRLGACHILDVPLAFGNAASPLAARLLGTPPPPGFAELSAQIRTAWTSFAATGDPGWPRFDRERGTTRSWNVPATEGAYPLPASRRIWLDVVPTE